jgi:hypothetical protein
MSQNASRKLKRRLIERALKTKVSVVAPEAPAPPALSSGPPPKTRRLRLPMSDEQMGLLANAQGRVQAAQSEFEMVLRVVLAQHHIVEGQVVQILPGRPPKVLVQVPDAGAGAQGRRKKK